MSTVPDKFDKTPSFHTNTLTEKKNKYNPKKDVEKYDVLVVEDNTDDRLLALKTLKKSPYINDVRAFRSGDELMAYFTDEGYYSDNLMRFIPTLILLDIHMPGTNGIDILRRLKAHPATADIPVIITTIDMSNDVLRQAKKLRANAFIAKPVSLDQVHEVIFTGWGWSNGSSPVDENHKNPI